MQFLLDTNVVSELFRPLPEPKVVSWMSNVEDDRVFLSVITLAEVSFGIERLAEGNRRQQIARWLKQDLMERFDGQILDIDVTTALIWGLARAATQKTGRPIPAMDGFIAATAKQHNLTLVTRNTKDFGAAGIDLLNPWEL